MSSRLSPLFGDESRQLGPPFDQAGNAAYFSALNRGKRAITLDLTLDADKAALLVLLKKADVLVENFIPGTMEKWGLGYEDYLSKQFPKLIYCSISGFGKTGPLGGLPGYDAVLQAMCGLMSINGTPESGPTKIGIPIVDHLTAYTAFSGISMALYEREAHGTAPHVEAVLFDAALSLLVPHAANWISTGVTPALLGSAHPNISPYDSFKTKDGSVYLGVLNGPQFKRLCSSISRNDLFDNPDYASNSTRLQNRLSLHKELESEFSTWSRDDLCKELMDNKVPIAPINTVPEALGLEHTKHRQMIVQQGAYQGLGKPAKVSSSSSDVHVRPPKFAEHDSAIKARLNDLIKQKESTETT